MLKIVASSAIALLLSSPVIAQTEVSAKEAVNLSYKSPKAFECSLLAEDSDQKRILQVALDSGRRFLQFKKNQPHGFEKIKEELPLIWHMTMDSPNSSDDFVLGQVFSIMAKALVSGKATGDIEDPSVKSGLFNERGCVLL